MAAKKKKPERAPQPPKVHEAELGSGASGAVIRGVEIDQATAIARRQAGLDIVVCGDDVQVNRKLAREIEAAVGPPTRPQAPTKRQDHRRCLIFISKRAVLQKGTRSTRPTTRKGRPGKGDEVLHPRPD